MKLAIRNCRFAQLDCGHYKKQSLFSDGISSLGVQELRELTG